ncbi:MAG: leucine-rich repeat protein [Clostridia bacterium]|nr:leucine-rich repeat protein [Clostridia bacterium]
MKKSVKRIACAVLSMMLASTLVAEYGFRLAKDDAWASAATTATDSGAKLKNVTGQFDTSKIIEENFNDSVLRAEDVAPTYETRTVMVTLSGKPLVDRAGKDSVSDYLQSFSAEMSAIDLANEQNEFLRALTQKGIPYKLKREYDTVINAVAIEVDTKYVSDIKEMSGVKSAVITTAYAEPKTVEVAAAGSGVVTNETDVYKTGIYDSSAYAAAYGEGTVVAVLDTGLDYTHNAFQRFESENVDVAWSQEYVADKLNGKIELEAEKRSGTLNVNEVYVSEKVPFAYDYADDDPDVYPSYSNHGTHVAGIIGGYDTSGYTDKDGNPISETFKGVVPDAQLVICKVFTDDLDDKDLGGAVAEDIVAALEDCVTLGVDVINMSLGTSCGFTTTNDGDDEGEMLDAIYKRIEKSGISLICAASNDYSAGYGGVFGTNLASNPDSGTVGSPSTFAGALSVASINGQKADYMISNKDTESESFVFYEESRDIDGNPFDFCGDLTKLYGKNTFEYVVVPGVGHAADYTSTIKKLFKNGTTNYNRIALIKRGDTTFQEKVEVAMSMGAAGVIVYNNVAGVIRMNLGEIENPIPSVSVTMNAGNALVKGAVGRVGTIELDETYAAGPFMSEFSSWGPTHDLKLKPEITAHGGEITSAVPGGYGEQSGTSMATPNMAGFMALVRSYIKNDCADLVMTDGEIDYVKVNRLAMQLTMSTAGTVYDQDGLPYSPRKQGAGVAKLENVIGGTNAYLWTEFQDDNGQILNDYRPKIELGDDKDKTGEYVLKFNVTNFGASVLTFATEQLVMTETLASDGLAVTEQAHLLNQTQSVWSVDGVDVENGTIEVGAGETKKITVTLSLGLQDRQYVENSFENGMYVEGFLKLNAKDEAQCDLTIPFLGFYGDWTQSPMLDYSAFEVAASAQDASVKDEDKIRASVWETLPYNSYYNETYILPMGGYVYLLPEDDEPMYVDEEHCSVSRYNDNNDWTTELDDYMTSTAIKAVYAGLLKNARLVRYSLYNVETGEVIIANEEIYRVSKAYSGGGQSVPANVELELSPEAYGLVGNGKYKMDFEFFQNDPAEGEKAKEEDTYSFTFTVDYEAPKLEDARIRYYNYKDGTKEKQRVYLDVDVYDNHYPQAVMLCYPKTETVDGVDNILLQLATEYPTPVRKAVRNGTTTVSIEITDIYKEYFENGTTPMYIQVDDYAVNSCLYELNLTTAKADVLPEANEFTLAEGESDITLNIYETHKVALQYADSYTGNADLSNFNWSSSRPAVARVRNGEIVGLREGTAVITVDNYRNGTQKINVTVTNEVASTYPNAPTVSFGTIKTEVDALVKAQGVVPVNAGKTFTLTIETDPWYYPYTKNWQNIRFKWETNNPRVATVDENTGEVSTLTKGTAIISAVLQRKNDAGEWENTLYGSSVTLKVQNEFTVSNYTLTKYNGVGGEVVIPSDMNIWYIAEDAFKDNDNITKLVIPASVIDINEYAFQNCTALEEVYFVSEEHRVDENGNIINPDIDWSNLKMIYEYAFTGCKNLRKVDLTNVKTATVAHYAFAGCSKLEEVVEMPSIGTMHDGAFAGTALKSVDLTGLHMSGNSVFASCTQLTEIKTGKFTAIGNYMFDSCTGLVGPITLNTPKIGASAFRNCKNLTGVTFKSPDGEKLSFDIGAGAFENCGTAASSFTVDFGGETIRTIGDRAFANSALTTLDFSTISGLQYLGGDVFAGSNITSVVLGDGVNFENIQFSGAPFVGKTITVAENSTKYVEENGVIYNANKTKILFVNSSVTGEYLVPETVTEIAPYAFANSGLSTVSLGENVSKIGEYAFVNSALSTINFNNAPISRIEVGTFENSKLQNVSLPNGVEYVGSEAFAKSYIQSFSGAGVTELGDSVFNGCTNLTAVEIENVTKMGSMVFAGCTALTNIDLPAVTELGYYTFRGATGLQTVSFAAGATTTGKYTFENTSVETVTFNGNGITEIETGAFYNARKLSSVTLPEGIRVISDFAFEGTRSLTKLNLENVEIIGMQAFYNSGLNELTLTKVKYIGDFAFAVQDGATGGATAYTSVSMPIVEEIGAHAFLNNAMTSVEIPASLKKLGAGAFASAASLKTVTVEDGNENFFIPVGHEDVLYRYVDKAAGTYELALYPAARVNESKAYNILEETVRVDAYAFYDLNNGALEKVTLPYSINTIGDAAFFASGIMQYTFESIQAPTLEAEWRQEIQESLANGATLPYRGYYYANFETYLYNYSEFVKEENPLMMEYPSNGKGYENHIYRTYFGTRTATEPLMEDDTRTCLKMIESMYNAEEISTWMNWEVNAENKALVEAFSQTVKQTRLLYNNAMKIETQIPFITEEYADKLLAVETALRDVKAKFGVIVKVSEIKLSGESTHKTEYKVGESFDMTGLVIIVVYDDYSTDVLQEDDVTLVTTKLTKYTKYVEVSYEGKKTRIPITIVTEEKPVEPEIPDDSSEEESSAEEESSIETESSESRLDSSSVSLEEETAGGGKKGCGGAISGIACGILALGVCGIALYKKKEN